MAEISTGPDPMARRHRAAAIEEVPNDNSAVSWAAIFAGAAGAAALSLLLLILGTGLGFSAVSPWTMEGVSAATFGFSAIAWLTFTQIAASGMGGYLAGRLRTKWVSVHADEVFFRDTAHGFLSWAVAALLTAAVLTSVVGAIIGGGVQAGAEAAGGSAGAAGSIAGPAAATQASGEGEESNDTLGYYIDSLFRSAPRDPGEETEGDTPQASEIPVGEVTRILTRALRTGTLPQEDQRYIGQLVAQRTDLSQREAEQRVSESFDRVQSTLEEAETTAREAADTARKASAYGALWLFITLLIGAFTASLMAIFGGRQRDA